MPDPTDRKFAALADAAWAALVTSDGGLLTARGQMAMPVLKPSEFARRYASARRAQAVPPSASITAAVSHARSACWCVQCGDEHSGKRPIEAWSEQSAQLFECIDVEACAARRTGRHDVGGMEFGSLGTATTSENWRTDGWPGGPDGRGDDVDVVSGIVKFAKHASGKVARRVEARVDSIGISRIYSTAKGLNSLSLGAVVWADPQLRGVIDANVRGAGAVHGSGRA